MRSPLIGGLSILALLLLFAPAGSLADRAVIQDDEFANWSWEYLASRGASAYMIRETSGGNPGACARATTNMLASHIVWLCMWKEVPIWDPSVDGEIIELSLQIDTRGDITEADGQNLKLFLLQGDSYYGGPVDPFLTATGSSTFWHTMNLDAMPSDDFVVFMPYWPDRHPDFTSTGGPIHFGFMIGNSATGNPRSISHLYDNWQVTIEFIGTTPVEATTWGRIKEHYR